MLAQQLLTAVTAGSSVSSEAQAASIPTRPVAAHAEYTAAHWEGHAGRWDPSPTQQAHGDVESLPSAFPELSTRRHNLQTTEVWGKTAGEVGAQGRHLAYVGAQGRLPGAGLQEQHVQGLEM